MIESKEIIIDEDTFLVTQLPARRALKLKSKLIKYFGPGLTQFFLTSEDEQEKEVIKPDGTKKEISAEEKIANSQIREIRKNSLVKAIQLAFSDLNDKTIDELLNELFTFVRRNGVEVKLESIDLIFAGKLEKLYKLILFILEVNFSSFLSLSAIGDLLGTKAQKDPITNLTWPKD